MLRIKKIQLLYMRNDKHFQFFRAFLEAVLRFGASVLKIERQFAEWSARFEREALLSSYNTSLFDRVNVL